MGELKTGDLVTLSRPPLLSEVNPDQALESPTDNPAFNPDQVFEVAGRSQFHCRLKTQDGLEFSWLISEIAATVQPGDPGDGIQAVLKLNADAPLPEAYALSPKEEALLARCEREAQEGLKGVARLGRALQIIRDQRLYRRDFHTFEEYVQDRFGIERQTAYRFIDGYQVISDLRGRELNPRLLPSTESQARELKRVTPNKRPAVLKAAASLHPDGKITARNIKQAATDLVDDDQWSMPELHRLFNQIGRVEAHRHRPESCFMVQDPGEPYDDPVGAPFPLCFHSRRSATDWWKTNGDRCLELLSNRQFQRVSEADLLPELPDTAPVLETEVQPKTEIFLGATIAIEGDRIKVVEYPEEFYAPPQPEESDERYSPWSVVNLARQVFPIQFDPTSTEWANEVIRAEIFYTKDQNSFVLPWYDRAWINFPYGATLIKLFVTKLLIEMRLGRVTEALVLCNASNGFWKQQLCSHCTYRIEPAGRIGFYTEADPDGEDADNNRNWQDIYYIGQQYKERVVEVFRPYAHIWTPPINAHQELDRMIWRNQPMRHLPNQL
ncbi:MAG: hypothetical protein AAGF24_01990 [Cyanobacteria bacterium P01_H01_bin.121]